MQNQSALSQSSSALNPTQVKRVLRYRLVVFIAIALAGMFTQFHRSSTGVIYNDLTAAFGLTASSFSTFSVMYFYPYVAMQIPVGILADRWGVRNTVSVGCLIAAAGTLLFSTAHSFELLCLGRALVGVGVSAPIVCAQKLMAAWFLPNEVTTFSGISSFFSGFAGLLSQAPLAVVVGVLSWRYTFAALGIASAAAAALCFFLIRNKPEDMGLPAIERLEGPAAAKAPPTDKVSVWRSLLDVFNNRYVWPMLIIMPAEMGAYTLFSGTWGVPYLQAAFGYSNVEASTFTSYLMGGMITGSLVIGFISDRLRTRKKVMIFITVLTFLEWLAIYFGQTVLANPVVLSIAMALFGITAGAVTMSFAIVREVNDRRYTGIAAGATNTIGMLASAIFPSICGGIIDRYSSTMSGAALYQRAFLFVVVATGIAMIVSFFVKETDCKYIEANPWIKRKTNTGL